MFFAVVGFTDMYFIYVLRSQKNGRLYTGSAKDVGKRIAEHNAGQTASTKLARPYVLV